MICIIHCRHVMISYQWDAQERMKTLKDKLENEGFQVWLDIEKIEAEYAYNRNVPIIPLKVDHFKPDDWLGAFCGTKMYYHVGTDEMLNKNWSGLLRDINARIGAERAKHNTNQEPESNKGVSENILRWRTVLNRQRPKLQADMDPKMLVSRLKFLSQHECAEIEKSSDPVETLLGILLRCKEEAWPKAFIDALQGEAKYVHLANALEEFENVASEIKTQKDNPTDRATVFTEKTKHSTKESPCPASSNSDDDED
ncbi:uncharacterized protein [Amphiura filiformis]|uniref:uncharacterized protein n=1 Tax=Amphiura filiformis TaxID=82378 RepID=UPI003B216B0C